MTSSFDVPSSVVSRSCLRQAGVHLIEERLRKNDLNLIVGHHFNFCADWGAVDCQVLAVELNKALSYTWAAYSLESVVSWTLTPTSAGTRLRMEQSGFPPDQPQYYEGAKGGWQVFTAFSDVP